MNQYRVVAAAVLVLAVALTGCAGRAGVAGASVGADPTGAAPTASPVESSTAAPQVSATPAPPASPEPTAERPSDDWPIITTAGIGDLRIGSPVPSGTSLAHWDPHGCDGRGDWIGSLPNGDPFIVYVERDARYNPRRDGDVTGFIVGTPEVLTRSGAHVGMSLDALRELFPGATEVRSSYLGDSDGHDMVIALEVADSSGTVAFNFYDRSEPVENISVTIAGADPVLTWGNDAWICGI